MPLKEIIARKVSGRAFRNPPVDSRHELVIALGVIFFFGGVGAAFVRFLRPKSVIDFVPHWVALLWLFICIVGGLALLVSILIRDRIDALVLEWPALAYIGGGAMVYNLCLLGQGLQTGYFATVTYGALGLACLYRSSRVALWLRHRGKGHDVE